jgi:hypothetical protein
MFPGDVFLRVQQDLYANYGAAGGVIEGAAFLSTLGTGYLVRRRPRTRSLILVALACNLVTTLIWATLINPINRRTLSWSTETLPPDWPDVRDRWHALHAARLILCLVGFGALIASVLEDARAATRG